MGIWIQFEGLIFFLELLSNSQIHLQKQLYIIFVYKAIHTFSWIAYFVCCIRLIKITLQVLYRNCSMSFWICWVCCWQLSFPQLQNHLSSVTFWFLTQELQLIESLMLLIMTLEKGTEEEIIFSGTGSPVWNPVL